MSPLSSIKLNKAAPLSLLLILVLLVVPTTVFASELTTGSGNFAATITSATTVFSSGGYTLYHDSGPDVLTGTEAGTGTFTIYLLVFPSGASVGAGSVTCPCAVAGRTGTLRIEFTTQGTPTGTGTGQGTVTGSGGLEGLHGHVTFQYVATGEEFSGPYQVQYEFNSDD